MSETDLFPQLNAAPLPSIFAWIWDSCHWKAEVKKKEQTASRRRTGDMDALALEATGSRRATVAAVTAPLPSQAPAKRKPAKKAKKAVVFFEVEILDAKTKDKLCFLDKVRA